MPANLPPDYHEAEQRFREAQTIEEKIAALKEMYAIIPKHKGTEKMRADIKRRLAKLRIEAQQKKKAGKKSDIYHIKKEGAGQAILVGPPNCGKSQLLASLTNAIPEIADYPFTTRKPLPGMMTYQNILIQIVDLPPIYPGREEGWIFALIRLADVVLLVVDLSELDPLSPTDQIIQILSQANINLVKSDAPVDFKQKSPVNKKTIMVCNKYDTPLAQDNYEILSELYQNKFQLIPVSALTGFNLDLLKDKIYSSLEIIRVYAKEPGKQPDLQSPFVMKKNSTVLEFARGIHKDFEKNLKFARIWGATKFDGQKVTRDYILQEGDIVELNVK